MRPIIQVGVFSLFPKEICPTEACKKLVRKLVVDDTTLQEEARKDLVALEGNNNCERDVAKILSDIWSELSKIVHCEPLTDEIGFHCGGIMPLRAASALMILQLQKDGQLADYGVIKYANKRFEVKAFLQHGNVKEKEKQR